MILLIFTTRLRSHVIIFTHAGLIPLNHTFQFCNGSEDIMIIVKPSFCSCTSKTGKYHDTTTREIAATN